MCSTYWAGKCVFRSSKTPLLQHHTPTPFNPLHRMQLKTSAIKRGGEKKSHTWLTHVMWHVLLLSLQKRQRAREKKAKGVWRAIPVSTLQPQDLTPVLTYNPNPSETAGKLSKELRTAGLLNTPNNSFIHLPAILNQIHSQTFGLRQNIVWIRLWTESFVAHRSHGRRMLMPTLHTFTWVSLHMWHARERERETEICTPEYSLLWELLISPATKLFNFPQLLLAY